MDFLFSIFFFLVTPVTEVKFYAGFPRVCTCVCVWGGGGGGVRVRPEAGERLALYARRYR